MESWRDWKFTYCVGPIDFFAGTMTIGEFIQSNHIETKQLSGCGNNEMQIDYEQYVIKFAAGLAFLQSEVNKRGMFMDGIEQLYIIRVGVLPLPDLYCCVPYLVCKQQNNGQVFIASPIRMPWLEEIDSRGK